MSQAAERRRPMLTVDTVLVAPMPGTSHWRVLLVKRKNPPFRDQWALPGGFVEPDEPLEEAARRELWEETGLEPARLDQLYTFGDPARDPRGWTVSVAYLAVLNADEASGWQPRAASDAQDVGWFDLTDPPALAFDHADILARAQESLLTYRY